MCTRLDELDCQGCYNLLGVPDALGRLSNLRVLNLSHCKAMAALPAVLEWPALATLNLSNCTRLAALPAALGGCPLLRDLSLANTASLCELPDLSGLSDSLTINSLPPRLEQWKAGGYVAISVPVGASRGSYAQSSSVIVSTFQSLFSLSPKHAPPGGTAADGMGAMSEANLQDYMARRLQNAVRARMRYRLLMQLRRLSHQDGSAASAGAAPAEEASSAAAPLATREYTRNGSVTSGKASAMKAKIA